MILKFFQELYQNLIKEDFHKLDKFYESEIIDDNIKYLSLGKSSGSIFYVIFIFNMKKISYDELEVINNNCIKFFENLQSKNNLSYVIITNLMITENENSVRDFINSQNDFVESSVNSVYWGIDMEKGNILLNKNNPTKILNLIDIIHNSYKNVRNSEIKYTCEKSIVYLEKCVYEQNSKVKSKIPIITYSIILINLLMFIFLKLDNCGDIYRLISHGAIVPEYIIYNKEYFRLVTYMFMHITLSHFICNSLALYIFGTRVEKYYGKINFVIIYLISGIVAGINSVMFTNNLTIGSSGAVFGIVASLAVMANIFKKNIDGLSYHDILIYIILAIWVGYSSENIDNFGHLGGLLSGLIISFIICKKDLKKEKIKNEYFRFK